MQKDDHVRLRHMLDAAREAEIFIQSKTRDSLETDRELVFALIKCIEIVGEAAANVTNQCRDNLPQIPWPSIIEFRGQHT